MFCPQCGGTIQNEELKFCKQCGANLYAVRQVMFKRETDEKFDWSKTWVAEMFMSEGERKRREQQLEEQRGITPEVKRYNEIKAGVITSSVGIGLMIFLYVFMQGIVLGNRIPDNAAEIISRVWIAGVIPFFVGLALMINGIVVSKKLIETMNQERQLKEGMNNRKSFGKNTEQFYLEPANTSEFIPSEFSVTEDATRKLSESEQKR
jgi:hypothetical protein